MTPLTIGSLFSGIGGLELGLEMGLGEAETRWQVEYEEHARLILAQHWPDAERHQDVRHAGRDTLIPVDLICGGFPCQPHSVAGKRLASRDERDLWGEFARIIGELRPRWVVAENVPGLLSSSDPAFQRDHPGGFFGRVLRDLAEMGFDAEWACFPAASVGAPHKRDRVFLVAHAHHTRGHGSNGRGQETGRPQPESCCADVAHADRADGEARSADRLGAGEPREHAACSRGDVPHALRAGSQGGEQQAVQRPGRGEEREAASQLHPAQVRHASSTRLPDWAGGEMGQPSPLTEFERPDGREVERDFRGVPHGVSLRVDRLTRLGNGVVPQQAAVIGRAIRDAETHWQRFGVTPERIIRPEHWREA